MPAAPTEMATHARRLLIGAVMPDTVPTWADGTAATDDEMHDIRLLLLYEAELQAERKARCSKAQRTAMRLLRSFLSDSQKSQLSARGCFDVVTPSGRSFRFWPRRGLAEQLERHGKRLYSIIGFCLHDEGSQMPTADVTLAQLLLLSVDEEEFLRLANHRRYSLSLWDGEWRRRLNAAARERAAALERAAAS